MHPRPRTSSKLLPILPRRCRFFSTSCRLLAAADSESSSQNHYQVLAVPYTASPSEIKKQFYTLSKEHHPDLHPDDTTASNRFHRLVDAYQVLSSPDKRARYDRQIGRHTSSSSTSSASPATTTPKGSFSSHTGPLGGRPASGLSRRRTQFRGPPPSFYRQGAWGAHTGKRSAAAAAGHAANSGQKASAAGDDAAAEAPAEDVGSEHGWAHWNRAAHLRTHRNIDARFDGRRARAADQRMHAAEEERKAQMRDTLVRAAVMTGLLATIMSAAAAFHAFTGVSPWRGK